MWFSLVVALACCPAAGCSMAGDPPENAGRENTSSGGPSKEAGGVTVGEALAKAELEPVGDSATSGTAVFREVGNLGVQVDLTASSLPAEDPSASYYAQVHEGSCSDERTEREHAEEAHGASFAPTLALLRFDRVLAKVRTLEAHGGHEHSVPEVPPGRIDQPIVFSASAEGTARVSSLLEGIAPERLTSGPSEYVHVHTVGSEAATDELACGDLVEREHQGSG